MNFELFGKETALITDEIILSYKELENCIQMIDPSEMNAVFATNKNWEEIPLLFSLFRHQKMAFPVNPKFPLLPTLPENIPAGLATCILTSGSSGTPKRACHSLSNHIYNAQGFLERFPMGAPDRYLLSLPLYHVGGLAILFRTFLSGSCLVFSQKPMLQAILDYKITHLSLVPTQLYRLLQEDADLVTEAASHLKFVLLGGAPLPPALYQEALEKGFPVHRSYGMTEMSSVVTVESELLHYREVKTGLGNEIFVKGKTLFQGYLMDDGELTLPLDHEGWFATKDIAGEHISRKDRLFISGGENIQPEEIEHALLSLPGIIRAKVVPQTDKEFGQRPFAYIQDETHAYTLEEIQTALRKKLPGYKIPTGLGSMPAKGPKDF